MVIIVITETSGHTRTGGLPFRLLQRLGLGFLPLLLCTIAFRGGPTTPSTSISDLRRDTLSSGRLGVSSFPKPGTPQTENYLHTGTLSAHPDRNATALAALRIAVGALFLLFAQYKVFGRQFTLGGGFQSWINRFLAEGAYPFMVGVLRNFVLPHGTAIAFLVAYGELAIGLALVLGFLVRAASVCGIIFMLTLLFSSNYPGPDAPLWQYFGAALDHLVLALCFAAFALGDSARVLSLRRILRSRRT